MHRFSYTQTVTQLGWHAMKPFAQNKKNPRKETMNRRKISKLSVHRTCWTGSPQCAPPETKSFHLTQSLSHTGVSVFADAINNFDLPKCFKDIVLTRWFYEHWNYGVYMSIGRKSCGVQGAHVHTRKEYVFNQIAWLNLITLGWGNPHRRAGNSQRGEGNSKKKASKKKIFFLTGNCHTVVGLWSV